MKRFAILFAIVALVVLGWSGGWLYYANGIRTSVEAMARPAAPGAPTLDCAELGMGGFPFRFDLTCRNFVYTDGDLSVSVPQIKATALVYRPTHILAFFTGPARYSDAFHGSEQEANWTLAEASIRLDGWKLARASLHAESLEIRDPLFDTVTATSPLAEFHLIDMAEQHDPAAGLMTIGVFERAESVELPQAGIADAEMLLEAEITKLPDDIRLWGDPEILRYWQQVGGQIKLLRLTGSDPRSSFAGEGTLALDSAGRPEGQLTLTSQGIVENLGQFLPEGLGPVVFGAPAEDGSYTQTLNLRSGVVLSGIVPVATLPALF